MTFASTLLHSTLQGSNKEKIGTITDIIVEPDQNYPLVKAFVISKAARRAVQVSCIKIDTLHSLEAKALQVDTKKQDVVFYYPKPNDLFIARDILDTQIVDTNGMRIVKVNDVKFVQARQGMLVVGVDISLCGFIRWLGLGVVVRAMRKAGITSATERIIPWNTVEMFQKRTQNEDRVSSVNDGENTDIQLRISQCGRTSIHAMDICSTTP